MITVQFITSKYVKKYTICEENVDDTLVNKAIWKAQGMYILEALGTNLYNKMVSDYPNYQGQYLTLINSYIQPALSEWALYNLVPFINFRFTNKAVSTKSSDNSQPSTIDDLKWIRDDIRKNAEFLTEMMKDYIKNNISLFPEYYQRINSFDLSPNRTNYFSGIKTNGRVIRAPLPPLNNINTDDFGCC